MTRCNWFRSNWDRYLDEQMNADEQKLWHLHAETCADCGKAWQAWRDLAPRMREDKEALLREPSPFFFARQLREIEEKIEAGATQRWWHRIFFDRHPRFTRPALALFILVGMVTSWSVFRTGSLPFFGMRAGTRIAQEILISEDMMWMLFDVLSQSEDIEALALLL